MSNVYQELSQLAQQYQHSIWVLDDESKQLKQILSHSNLSKQQQYRIEDLYLLSRKNYYSS